VRRREIRAFRPSFDNRQSRKAIFGSDKVPEALSGFLEKESPCFGHLDAAIAPQQKTRLHLVLEPPN
jgi:hypothetical protein